MNNKRTFFISLTFFAAIVACVIPGLPTASAPLPVPTVDTGILSTMVAETVSAAIVLTEQAFPTPTIVPSSTPTSIPTISPTAEIVPSGTTLTVQEDGSTLFVDERAGYEVTVPAGWLAVRVNEQEYRDALINYPDIYISLPSMQSNDPNVIRLFVIDTQDEHFQNDFFTNINFIWDEQGAISFENDEDLKASAVRWADTTPGLEILATTLSATSNGIPIGLIDSKSTLKNSSNADVIILQRQVIFKARVGTMAVTVSTVEGLKDTVFSTFEVLLQTIKISAE